MITQLNCNIFSSFDSRLWVYYIKRAKPKQGKNLSIGVIEYDIYSLLCIFLPFPPLTKSALIIYWTAHKVRYGKDMKNHSVKIVFFQRLTRKEVTWVTQKSKQNHKLKLSSHTHMLLLTFIVGKLLLSMSAAFSQLYSI